MNVNNPTNYSQVPLSSFESNDPVSVFVPITLVGTEKNTIDLTHLTDMQNFEGVKCVFINNTDSSAAVNIEVRDTQQIIKCPAGKQGYFPILSPRRPVFRVWADSAGNNTVKVNMMNFTLSQGVW